MAFDLDELHVVLFGLGREDKPEILVFDLGAVAGFPAILFPVIDPMVIEGLDKIVAVGIEFDVAGLLQGAEAPSGRRGR